MKCIVNQKHTLKIFNLIGLIKTKIKYFEIPKIL
jgi:hypothetical protein